MTRKKQAEFRAIESLLVNTKNLCDTLLNDIQNRELILCDIRQEKIEVAKNNIITMNDETFISFVSNDLYALLNEERERLMDIWKWLDILETAENYLLQENIEEFWIAAKYCKDEIDELNSLADQLSVDLRKSKIPTQKVMDSFLSRKTRVQSILNVLSIARSVPNHYLVNFPGKNPEFKRTIDMIIGLFSYSEIFNENYFEDINNRMFIVKTKRKELEVETN